jgi:hypothetical protein
MNLGFLDFLLHKKSSQFSHSTSSGVGKDVYDDWQAMTEIQGGFFSAMTMARNLPGTALAFRCRAKDLEQMLHLSYSDKMQKYFFELGKRYKVRMQFSNSIVLYTYMYAYKQRHGTILNITDEFTHNLFDSEHLKLQYLADNNKKITLKFSLKGAKPAVNSTTARTRDNLKDEQIKEMKEAGEMKEN